MDVTATVEAPVGVEKLFTAVADLATYPQWLGIVHQVTVEPVGSDGVSAWLVELRGKVGPFARSKRLRMVQVETSSVEHLRFERAEVDGRSHSAWVLEAKVSQQASMTTLNMTLQYSGRLFSSVVERALHDEIEASKQRLRKLVAQ